MKAIPCIINASLLAWTLPGEELATVDQLLRQASAPIGGAPRMLIDWRLAPPWPACSDVVDAVTSGTYVAASAFAVSDDEFGMDWHDNAPVEFPEAMSTFLKLLDEADALQFGDGAPTTEWRRIYFDPAFGVNLEWYDKRDERSYAVAFSREALAQGRMDDKGRFHAMGDLGGIVTVRFHRLDQLFHNTGTRST